MRRVGLATAAPPLPAGGAVRTPQTELMASAAADIKLLAGTANPLLADEVSEAMGIPLCEVDIKTFADGEREARPLIVGTTKWHCSGHCQALWFPLRRILCVAPTTLAVPPFPELCQ